MMKQTLMIYGSLGTQGFKKSLAGLRAASKVTVLEVESLLPANQRPTVESWANALDLQSPAELREFDNDLNELLAFYLDAFSVEDSTDNTLPMSRRFRAASLGATCKKWIGPYLVNLDLARKMFQRGSYDRIVVTPGSGISFRAWQQMGAAHGIPVTFLEKEARPMSLSRRWLRLLNRWRKRPAAITEALPETPTGEKTPVLCTSARVARMLQKQSPEAQPCLEWAYVPVTAWGTPTEEELSDLRKRYQAWWSGCEVKIQQLIQESPEDSRSILMDLGRQQSSDIYPLFAWRYKKAFEYLAKARPQVLLCDMQEGSEERAWTLAANELGIPVIAYTYDHIPQPRFSIRPDWLLCDSGRNAHIARLRGHRPKEMLSVASHRRPPAALQKSFDPSSKILLFADSYYAGTIATVEPQRSYRHYLQLVEVARRMPNYQFWIKFHPLRDRKRMEQCFIGMDEDELHVRTQFIHSLKPPANVKLIAPENGMMELLPKAALMLNSNSTAAVEAFVLGIPVLFLHQPNVETGFPRIFDYEACIVADQADELESCIRQLTTDKDATARHIQNQRRYVDEFYWASGQLSVQEAVQSVLFKERTASHIASTGTPAAGPKD